MHDKCVHSSERNPFNRSAFITVHIVDTGTSSNANPAENITSSAVTVNVDPVLTAPVITPSSSTISADQECSSNVNDFKRRDRKLFIHME